MYHLLRTTALITSLTMTIGTARAQAAQAAPQAADNAAIQDIIVTAQRRSENLQNVPISITAVTADRLSASGISDAQDLQLVTPALTVNNSVGYFLPRLRGIGTSSSGAGLESPVAVYVDNVYYASTPSSLFSFNNIERIEVLKGPQGTLFGRNATGGVINVITKDPSHVFGGSASLSYGNYGTVSGDAYLTGGLTDTLAMDVAIQGRHQERGYGTNFATGGDANKTSRDFAIRSKLLWKPGPTTEVRLSVDYGQVKGSFPTLRDYGDTVPVFGPSAPGGPWDTNNDFPSRSFLIGGGATLRIDQQVGKLKLVSISAYRKSRFDGSFDFDLTPTPAEAISFSQYDHQFSQELQVQSGSGSPFTWIVGAYYFNATSGYDPEDFIVGGPLLLPSSPFFPFKTIRSGGFQRTTSLAGFGQATVPLTPTTNITAGIRFTHDHKVLEATQEAFLANGVSVGSILPPGVGQASKSFDKATWRLSIDQKLGDDAMAYASYNRGFKAGGFNITTPSSPAYLPEVLDAYEVGVKAELLDRHIRLNPAFFYYNYSNLQVQVSLPSGVQGTLNGPSSTVYGLDIDGEFVVSNAFRITAGASLIHDRFGDYPNAIFTIPNGIGNIQTSGQAKGNRLPFTADFSINAGANYTIHAKEGKVVLSGDWYHNDGFYTDADNLRRQNAFDVFNASITWSGPNDRYFVRAWGKNLSNQAVLIFNNAAVQATSASYQPPRTYGISIGTKL